MNLKTVRNYSLCFDKKLRVAHWVAYPLHASYIGSLDRSEAWAPDPKIPQQYQPALWLGGYQNGNVYNRGHQIPSKDRTTVEEMNKQTFYASNMTPQRGQFNQNMWAALEAKVRSYVCPDTLYVVTGCYFANLDESTKDKAGNVCPVPTNYFKVLLRTRDGATGKRIADCKASELKAIGFWVANEGNFAAAWRRSRKRRDLPSSPTPTPRSRHRTAPNNGDFNRVFDKPSAEPDAVRAMPGRENEE